MKMALFTKVASVIVSDIIMLIIDPDHIGIDTKIRSLVTSETDIWYKKYKIIGSHFEIQDGGSYQNS